MNEALIYNLCFVCAVFFLHCSCQPGGAQRAKVPLLLIDEHRSADDSELDCTKGFEPSLAGGSGVQITLFSICV